jgi:hypothetical protein
LASIDRVPARNWRADIQRVAVDDRSVSTTFPSGRHRLVDERSRSTRFSITRGIAVLPLLAASPVRGRAGNFPQSGSDLAPEVAEAQAQPHERGRNVLPVTEAIGELGTHRGARPPDLGTSRADDGAAVRGEGPLFSCTAGRLVRVVIGHLLPPQIR